MRGLVAVFLAFLGITFAQAEEIMIQPQTGGAELVLSATATENFANDEATVFLYAQFQSESVQKSQSEVNRLMSEANKKLASDYAGVKIESVGYTTEPVYSRPKEAEEAEIKAWRTRQTIKVILSDVKSVGKVVWAAQKAGLALQNLQFGLSSKVRNDAQRKLITEAMNNLNQKAASVAASFGLPLNSVQIAKLNFIGDSPRAMPMLARSLAADSSNDWNALPSFEAGTSSISTSVQATLKINSK